MASDFPDWMQDADWTRRLGERFLPRDSIVEECEWNSLKNRLQVGQTVSGEVVAKAAFGAWIDLEVGFPALLEIIFIDGLTPEKYRAGEWCPIGSRVSAMVRGFADDRHQVYLQQFDPFSRPND